MFNGAKGDMFAELRDVNFSRVWAVVKKHAAESKQDMDQSKMTDRTLLCNDGCMN